MSLSLESQEAVCLILQRISLKLPFWAYFTLLGSGCIQIQAYHACSITGESRWWSGREWPVTDTSEDAVLKTVLLAVRQYMEHEAMEAIWYDGKQPFDPHKSVI